MIVGWTSAWSAWITHRLCERKSTPAGIANDANDAKVQADDNDEDANDHHLMNYALVPAALTNHGPSLVWLVLQIIFVFETAVPSFQLRLSLVIILSQLRSHHVVEGLAETQLQSEGRASAMTTVGGMRMNSTAG